MKLPVRILLAVLCAAMILAMPFAISSPVLVFEAIEYISTGETYEVETEEVAAFEKRILREFRENHADILAEIRDTGDISDELSEKIKTVMDSVLENYRLVKGA